MCIRDRVRTGPGRGDRRPEVTGAVELAHDDRVHHAGGRHALEHRPDVGEVARLEVAVAIHQPHHFTGLPGGRSPGSTSFSEAPPSPAASTMPRDSMPRSARGLRFATTTTLRPTS